MDNANGTGRRRVIEHVHYHHHRRPRVTASVKLQEDEMPVATGLQPAPHGSFRPSDGYGAGVRRLAFSRYGLAAVILLGCLFAYRHYQKPVAHGTLTTKAEDQRPDLLERIGQWKAYREKLAALLAGLERDRTRLLEGLKRLGVSSAEDFPANPRAKVLAEELREVLRQQEAYQRQVDQLPDRTGSRASRRAFPSRAWEREKSRAWEREICSLYGTRGPTRTHLYNGASEGSSMATNLNKVLKHIHSLLAPPGGDQTDGELLARFVAKRDEASFAALVRRHGPMVLAVCRRMLRHDQDAEDCFQATFMVLARKAATVKRESVGSWLYAVAYRTSLEARAVNARRRKREKQVQEMPHPEVMPPEVQDWRPWLDQELNRLPEKYRAAIVACDLEGRSRKVAARLLGLSEGTLSSRLARGRRLLAKRLAPYGLSLSGATLAAALCESAASAQVPAALVSTTMKAALLIAAGELTAVSVSSAILMKGVLKTMFLTKLKLMVGAVMVVTALGASGLVYRAAGQPASPAEKQSDGKPKSELERLRHENELLKLNLEVVLEKVRAQEAELRALKAQPTAFKIRKMDWVAEGTPLRLPQFKEIQKPRNKEELQRAIDEMEKALKGLREQLKNEGVPKKGKTKEESQRDQSQLEKLEKGAKRLEDLRKLEYLKKLESESFMWQERAAWSERMSRPGRQYVTISQAEADQARFHAALLAVAEAALNVLREARDAETQRKATDALDKALKKLSGQMKQPESSK